MTKVKYEKLGTVDVTASDIAFLGNMFAVTNYIALHPELTTGHIELIGDLAQMIISGKESKEFIESLHNLEMDNKDIIRQFRKDHVEKSAEVAANIVLATVINGETSSLDSMLKQMLSETKKMQEGKEVIPNAPEAGYQ